jgi:phage gp46-like protein
VSDIGLFWNAALYVGDFRVTANDLERDEGLETALLQSLFLDREAADGDKIPDGTDDKRGWWGDGAPVVAGDRIGSRLWLLDRAKNTKNVLPDSERYASEATQWLLDDKAASAINVSASFLDDRRGYALDVEVIRPQGVKRFRFARAWAAEGL